MCRKNSIILYFDQYESIKYLPNEDKGLLLDAVFQYAMTGNVKEDLPPMVLMAFSFIRTALDIDREKYQKRCEKNRNNIGKRWNNNNTIEYERIQTYTNDTDTDTDTDTEKENDNDNVYNGESNYSADTLSFEKVWELYEKKGNRKTSLNRWNKLSKKKKELAIKNIPLYIAHTPDKKYRKNFETYIQNEVWNDEFEEPQPVKTNSNAKQEYIIPD